MAKLNNLTLDGKPVDFILYRGSNQYGSYAIWNSGWKECWANYSGTSNYEIITLPVVFKDTSYTFTTSEWSENGQTATNDNDTGGRDFRLCWMNKTVNTIRCSKATKRCIGLYACGW